MDTAIFYYVLFWICILGLCFGSFFNVVILRSLTGESIVFPSSKCPKCGNKLKPWHNIPVLSYVFLKEIASPLDVNIINGGNANVRI